MALKNMTPKQKLWTIIGGIGTLGAAVTGIGAVANSNYRPVLKTEVEHVLPAEDYQRLQIAGEQRIRDLNIEQLRIKQKVLNSDRRELRRDLANSRERADIYRHRNESVPQWLLEDIADTESQLQEIDGEKSDAETRMLELRGTNNSTP